jgi:hypothetical protein
MKACADIPRCDCGSIGARAIEPPRANVPLGITLQARHGPP